MGYLLKIALICGVILGGIAGVNIAVDPFGVYGMPTRIGFNASKVALSDYVRFAKPLQILHVQPRVVLLGSSRMRDGVDPVDISPVDDEAYNYGVTALSMHEAEAYAEHATRVAPVERLIVGLDFFQFNDLQPYRAGFDRNLLRGGLGPYAFFRSSLSYVALAESYATVMENRRAPEPIAYLTNGFHDRDARSQVPVEEAILAMAEDFYSRPDFYGEMTSIDASMDSLERMLAVSRERGIDVRVFLSPMHAAMHETVRQRGLWPLFEDWKRRVTEVAARVDTPVWDFSGYNEVTSVSFVDASRYYFDSSHYRPEIGRRIVEAISDPEMESAQPGGFGVRLTPDTIDAQLSAIDASRQTYIETVPDDVARLTSELAGLDQEQLQGQTGTISASADIVIR